LLSGPEGSKVKKRRKADEKEILICQQVATGPKREACRLWDTALFAKVGGWVRQKGTGGWGGSNRKGKKACTGSDYMAAYGGCRYVFKSERGGKGGCPLGSSRLGSRWRRRQTL